MIYLLAEANFENEVLGIILLAVVLGSFIGILFQEVRWSRKSESRVNTRLDELKERTVEETRSHLTATLRSDLEQKVRGELEERIGKNVHEQAEIDAEKVRSQAEADASKIIADAEVKAERVRAGAKAEATEESKTRREELDRMENRLAKREADFAERDDELSERETAIRAREKQLKKHEDEIEKSEERIKTLERNATTQLEKIASFTASEAKDALIVRVEEETKVEAAKVARQIEEDAIAVADRQAKKIISVAVQRWAGEYVAERCVAVVSIPNDDIKGRIIGREGRNIRAIEAATGTDIIIDDTPEAVMVSSFDPVRREIARLVLEKLVSDGRIHPSRIEEISEKTKAEVEKEIKERGERAAFELGLGGLHQDLLNLLGRLRYRTSYGQNQWSHSIEVGFLCGLMAAELGVNVKTARRAGLLHDIGKALTHEREGSHAVIGAEIAARCGENEIVRNAIAAHHNDEPQNSVYAHLVIAADALSGARPGARREILETYVQRLRDLERITAEFEGVEKSYAIQAGREIRVMVENSKVNDDQAYALSREIARKIEDELTYPGQIKVCVIRETRAVDFAK